MWCSAHPGHVGGWSDWLQAKPHHLAEPPPASHGVGAVGRPRLPPVPGRRRARVQPVHSPCTRCRHRCRRLRCRCRCRGHRRRQNDDDGNDDANDDADADDAAADEAGVGMWGGGGVGHSKTIVGWCPRCSAGAGHSACVAVQADAMQRTRVHGRFHACCASMCVCVLQWVCFGECGCFRVCVRAMVPGLRLGSPET